MRSLVRVDATVSYSGPVEAKSLQNVMGLQTRSEWSVCAIPAVTGAWNSYSDEAQVFTAAHSGAGSWTVKSPDLRYCPDSQDLYSWVPRLRARARVGSSGGVHTAARPVPLST